MLCIQQRNTNYCNMGNTQNILGFPCCGDMVHSLNNTLLQLLKGFSTGQFMLVGRGIPERPFQGVLLLNTVLTVERSQAGAHQGRGWESVTDEVIRSLSEQRSGVVFMLWGKSAQTKAALIDASKHCVLEAVHPSPLSAYRGFFGCGHFSKANAYMVEQGLNTIDWQRTPVLAEPNQIQLL